MYIEYADVVAPIMIDGRWRAVVARLHSIKIRRQAMTSGRYPEMPSLDKLVLRVTGTEVIDHGVRRGAHGTLAGRLSK